MSNQHKSKQNGALRHETTGIPPVSPSSSVGKSYTSGMLDITVDLKNPTASQRIPNSPENPNAVHAKMIMAFVSKLGALVEWRKLKLGNGETVYALCFPVSKWLIDPVSKLLTPR
jgi:hypothetical protein